jgi:outer membrane protein TolC
MVISNQLSRFLVFFLSCSLFTLSACTFHPDPLTLEEISERTEKDMIGMFGNQEPLDGELSLYQAMARAIKYNLDYRLQLMEKSMAGKILNASNYDLLPQIAANAGYNSRDEYNGANSIALTGPTRGEESLTTSTSQEKDIRTADVTVMWNVLDFGIGYFRAQQNADSIMVSEEIRRKVIQNIIRDVQYAYWRAAGSEILLDDLVYLLERAKSAYKLSREVSGHNLQPKLETLIYQRELLNNIRALWGLTQTLLPAKTELATLMNVKPGSRFVVKEPDEKLRNIPQFSIPVADLVEIAMLYRPELREEDYKARISAAEIQKTYMGMIPGLNLQFGYNFDSNSYLYTNEWYSAGAQISLNLVNLISMPSKLAVAETRLEITELRRQALTIGVLAQVHISLQRFNLAKEEYLITGQLARVDSELSTQMAAEEVSGRATELAVIQSETEAMVSRVRKQIAYADLQNASSMIYNSLGIDLLPEVVDAIDVNTLAAELEKSVSSWKNKVNGKDGERKKTARAYSLNRCSILLQNNANSAPVYPEDIETSLYNAQGVFSIKEWLQKRMGTTYGMSSEGIL